MIQAAKIGFGKNSSLNKQVSKNEKLNDSPDVEQKSNTAIATASYIAGAAAILGLTVGGTMVKGGADLQKYCKTPVSKAPTEIVKGKQTEQVAVAQQQNVPEEVQIIENLKNTPEVSVISQKDNHKKAQVERDYTKLSEQLVKNGYRLISASKIGLAASNVGLAVEIEEPKYAAGAIAQGIAYGVLLGASNDLLAKTVRAVEAGGSALIDTGYAHYDFKKNSNEKAVFSSKEMASDVSKIGELVLKGNNKKAKGEIGKFYKKYTSIGKKQASDVLNFSTDEKDPRAGAVRAKKRALLGGLNGMLAACLATSVASSVANSAMGATIVQAGKTPFLVVAQEYSQKAADLMGLAMQGVWGANLHAYTKDPKASKAEKGLLVSAIGLGIASAPGTGTDASNAMFSVQGGVQTPYFLNKNKEGKKEVLNFFKGLCKNDSKNSSVKPLQAIHRKPDLNMKAAKQHFKNLSALRAPEMPEFKPKSEKKDNRTFSQKHEIKKVAVPDISDDLRPCLNRFGDVEVKKHQKSDNLRNILNNKNKSEKNKLLSLIKNNYEKTLKNFDARGTSDKDPFEVFDRKDLHSIEAGFKAGKKGIDYQQFILHNLNRPLGGKKSKTLGNFIFSNDKKLISPREKDSLKKKLSSEPLLKFKIMQKANKKLKQNIVQDAVNQMDKT